jgi:hypothetical protein
LASETNGPHGVRDSIEQYWAKAHLAPDLNNKKVWILIRDTGIELRTCN